MNSDKTKTTLTETLITCPCGKLIDSGITCKSCAPAFAAGLERGLSCSQKRATKNSLGQTRRTT